MTLAFDHSQRLPTLATVSRPVVTHYIFKTFSVLGEFAVPALAALAGDAITLGVLILLEYSI